MSAIVPDECPLKLVISKIFAENFGGDLICRMKPFVLKVVSTQTRTRLREVEMTDDFDGNAGRAAELEVERLLEELVSEIGATETPFEIRSLALKLQTMIDARKEHASAPA